MRDKAQQQAKRMCYLSIFSVLWFGFFMLNQHHFCSEADPNVSNNYKKEEKNKTKQKGKKKKRKGLAQIVFFFSNICGLAVQSEKNPKSSQTPQASSGFTLPNTP